MFRIWLLLKLETKNVTRLDVTSGEEVANLHLSLNEFLANYSILSLLLVGVNKRLHGVLIVCSYLIYFLNNSNCSHY